MKVSKTTIMILVGNSELNAQEKLPTKLQYMPIEASAKKFIIIYRGASSYEPDPDSD